MSAATPVKIRLNCLPPTDWLFLRHFPAFPAEPFAGFFVTTRFYPFMRSSFHLALKFMDLSIPRSECLGCRPSDVDLLNREEEDLRAVRIEKQTARRPRPTVWRGRSEENDLCRITATVGQLRQHKLGVGWRRHFVNRGGCRNQEISAFVITPAKAGNIYVRAGEAKHSFE